MRAFHWLRETILPTQPATGPRRARPTLEVVALEARRVLNAAPVVNDQAFAIHQGAPSDALIGVVTAADADPADALIFSITNAGGSGALFKIDPTSGELKINQSPTALNVGTYSLTITVTDLAGATDTATVSVDVLAAEPAQDDAPIVNDQQFTIAAGSGLNTNVGTVIATEPDQGDNVSYSLSGTEFSINGATGVIKVADAAAVLNPGKYVLTVTVEDNGGNIDTAQITIVVNGAPTNISIDNLTVAENDQGATIGNVTVTDPNFNPPGILDDEFTFEITGDAQNRFEIVGGQLKLKANATLDHETEPTISLSIKAIDRGNLSFTKNFDVLVSNVNETPTAVALDNLTVDENSLGAVIGGVTVTDVDDNTFTYQIQRETTPGNYVADARFEVDGGGNLKLVNGQALDHEAAATIKLRIIATDAGGLSAQNEFLITVNDVNETPTDIDLSPATVAENAPGATIGTVTVTDPDDPLDPFGQHTFSVQEDYGGGFVTSTRFEIVAGELKLLAGVSLDFESEPQVTVRILADDGSVVPAFHQDVVVTVTDENDPPTDIALSNDSVNENDPGADIGTVTVTDQDPGGDPSGQHTFTVEDDSGGAFAASTKFEIVGGVLRLISGVALDHEAAVITVRITADDGSGSPYSKAFAITVIDQNDAPTDIALSNQAVDENDVGAAIGTVTVTDADDPLNPFGQHTFSVREDYGSGYVTSTRFEIVAGELRLIAGVALDHETAEQITIRIVADDGTLPAFSKDFVITVNDVNEAPTDIALSNDTVNENAVGAIIGNVTVTDPDNAAEPFGQHALTVQEDYGGGYVTSTRFEIVGGVLQLKAGVSLDYEDAAAITIRIFAADGTAPTFSEDFVITVVDQNDLPTDITIDNDSVDENSAGAVVGNLTVTDQDSNLGPSGQHTFTVQEDYGGGFVTSTRFEVVGGVLKLIAGISLDHETAAQITVKIIADDGSVPPFSKNLVLDVIDVNEAPTDITLGNDTVAEESPGAVVGTVTVTDPDNPAEPFGQHTFTVREDYGGGYVLSTRFEIVGGQLRLKAGQSVNFETEPQITVRILAADGTLPTFSKDFVIDVVNQNDPPVAVSNEYSTTANQTKTGNVITDNTGLGVDSDEDLNSLTLENANGTYAPGQTFVTALGASVTVQADGSFLYDPTNSALLKALTALDDIDDSFTYRINDGQGGISNSATVTIHVTGVNDAPTVAPTGGDTGKEDTTSSYTFAQMLAEIGYSDPDNVANTATILITNVQGGTLSLIGGAGGAGTTFAFLPDANSHAPVTFDYQVLDAEGAYSNSGQFTITIRPVNDAPTFNVGNQFMFEDGQLTLQLSTLFSDLETPANLASYTVTANNSIYVHVSFDLTAGTVTFTLTPNFNGSASLTIRATDAGDGSDGNPDQDPLFADSSFTIDALPVDDAPVAAGELFTFAEDTNLLQAAGVLLANVTDVDADPLLNQFLGPSGVNSNSFVLMSLPLHAQFFAFNPDGSFTYVPNPDYFGNDAFTYVIYDLEGHPSNLATVQLQISPVNDPPVFSIGPKITINPVLPQPEPFASASAGPFENDQTISWQVQSADTNILPNPTVVADPSAPGQFLLQFSPAPFVNTITSITITATDSLGLSTVQVIQVELLAGQIPPANLAFEARQSIAFPAIRDAGPIVDLSATAAALVTRLLDSGAGGGEASSGGERSLEIYLIDPATGQVIGDAQVTLPGQSLDQLNQIFRSLPDDQYRLVLKLEDGSRRRVMDVIVRDRQPFNPGDTQDEFLIPNEQPGAEQGAPPSGESPAPPVDNAAPRNSDPALPLTPAGTREAPVAERASAPPWWVLAPTLLTSTLLQRQQRQQQATVRETLAQLGQRPWLLRHLKRPR